MKNNLRVWGGLVLCVPLALLGACAAGDKPKPAAVPAMIQAPGKARVTVSDADASAAVVVDTSQELRVELTLSAGEIANNMDWSLDTPTPNSLTVLGSRFERRRRDSNPSESEGATVFRFKPRAPGPVALNFALRRSYSLGPPTRSVSFDVTVK